ncbi:uncharacterized protein LOC112465226 isoform X1 [Temnothorax curvispinosus]|uniref:Uncharacterized protein LOC112465226 isoform X1 n=1 Tax=Temnothorax curvispinosus TaxID=300111 RepID=A0A6J1R1G6_9HYME|nr:uncharacterized protein LOC112465226 isoform X1 [Temnothorax curvispinosus]
MKNAHPIVSATTSSPVGPDSTDLGEPAEPIIRLKLQKPLHWEWELTTSADALPVIQLLDKDGRLLVETTGRTAQRARGSFKEGLRTHEQFSADESRASSKSKEQTSSPSTSSTASFVVTLPSNRNIDGFSNKFGTCNFAPRKSRSDVNIKEGRGKKRHSSTVEDPTMKAKLERNIEETANGYKRYSAGDYLRQQIMNDLRTRSTIGRTPDEVAKDRCRKVKAYLRSQSESLLSLVHEEECSGNETKDTIRPNEKCAKDRNLKRNNTINSEEKNSNGENKKVRSYLRTRSALIPTENSAKESSKSNEGDRVVRKIKDDMDEEELARIRAFLREKIQRRMNMEQACSRLGGRANVPETLEKAGIRKRYSDYSHEENQKNYRTRKVRSETSILRFNPEVIEREKLKSNRQSEKERSMNCRGSLEDSQLQRQSRNYRRSRSEALVQASESDNRSKSQPRRESSSLDRRKVYRKTKSDVLLGQMAMAAVNADSAKDLANPPRHIKSPENVEKSWREYKERKRTERLRRESEREVPEEDFMSKPRWKDLQRDPCFSRNCKVCQNLKNCVDPLYDQNEKTRQENGERLPRKETVAKVPEDQTSSMNGSRPGTSLQENYLLVGQKNADERQSPIIAKIQVKNRGNDIGSASTLNINSPDFGYNSIPSKRAFKDYRQLYTRSNVKKSDTFKIVDGSEDLEERANDSKINGVDGSDSDLGYLNGKISLANKSNEDITKDYFKRVYELLKRRQEEMKKSANENHELPGHDDSSSSNYIEEMQKKRHRRRRKDKSPQGEEVVTVPSTSNDQESWKAQRLSVNGESPQSSNRRRGCRPQLQPVVSGGKRNRPAPPPPSQPISYRVNAKDPLDRYFDWPNKENTPGNAVNRREDDHQTNQIQATEESIMGSNLSRHNGKGLTGRRTQSSGNLCDPKGKLNSMGKILVPCSSAQRERYKFCGSLPNHLDDKDGLDEDRRDNNNISSENVSGNFGTLPHKKRSLGVHFSDSGPTGTLDLVKHRSQDSLDENDPWRYQQSDLDLVRTRHSTFDSVKRNRSADTVLVDSGRGRYGGRGVSSEDRRHRNSDLDLVGTLPKRKQDARNSSGRSLESNSSSSQPCIINVTNVDDDVLMKMVHKPDCELLKHRQQLGKCVDLKLSKLSGEPQDQGYASERSPEDEHPPSLPGQPFPNVTPESTFRVTLQKSSRGLGLSVSGGGTAGPVRVKRLFPQQPAALSNKLQTGDILLAANGIPLTGLTNYEALEVLRTTPSTVELVVCRLPGESNVTPPGAPPPPPARREPPPPLRLLNPLPPLQIEPCGEFDIEMTKVAGSLGFTLRKADSSALGHYVRALVREPALSDGRIRPGDKIVAVDGAPLSPMSHEEAVQLLRQCGPTVKLRLYRDLAQTPVSALSPTEPDHPLRPPRTSLRQEAVDMLCDLAVRKLSPGTSSGSSNCKQQSPGASCNSPRRLRRLGTRTPTAETDQETPESKLRDMQTTSSTGSQAETTSDSDQCSVRTQITNSQANTPATDIIDPPPLYDIYDDNDDDDDESKSVSNNAVARPRFLDLSAPQGKPHFQFCSVDSDGEYPGDDEVILAEAERGRLAEPSYDDDRSVTVLSSDEHDNDMPSEPASMPPVLSSTSSTSTVAFSYKNPAYQSANPACGSAGSDPAGTKSKATHSSDQDIPGKILGTDDPGGSKGLLKWKGVMFAPNDEVDQGTEHNQEGAGRDTTDSVAPIEDLEQGSEVFMVELTRGWNSRLGFSLQPEGNRTVISVVHPDSVAAKDGRLRQGDVLLMVNEESVEHMSTADIIDLLRKIRGSIGITVMRKSKRNNIT